MYDKHAYSIIGCIFGIFNQPEVRAALGTLSTRSPFRLLDIGCGFGLEYTGYILYALALNGIRNVTIHAVDPALGGEKTDAAIRALKKSFPKAQYQLYPEPWSPNLVGANSSQFQFVIAIQTTTLFDDSAFTSLHDNLATLLCDGGIFIDISETDDRVTDIVAYPDIRTYSRGDDHRINVALKSGFCKRAAIFFPAHAVDSRDEQMMLGLAFSKRF